MTRRLLLCVLLAMGLCAVGFAQLTSDRDTKIQQIMDKVHRIDLLNQILPVLMTKDQLQKILPAVEKARAAARTIEKQEYEKLNSMSAEIEAALADAKKGKVSSLEFLDKLADTFSTFRSKRRLMSEANATLVEDAMKQYLNEGQVKAAALSLNPRIYDPSLDVTKLKEEDRLRIWIKIVLLDSYAYDVLCELAK